MRLVCRLPARLVGFTSHFESLATRPSINLAATQGDVTQGPLTYLVEKDSYRDP